jgi:hypothetical protein
MEPVERAVLFATTLQLRVDSCVVHDDGAAPDFRGPELLVLAERGALVIITPHRRTVAELPFPALRRLLDLADLAEPEPHREGADTAIARPLTRYHLRCERPLPQQRSFTTERLVNHLVPHSLGPHLTAFLTELAHHARPTAADLDAWDFAATWLGARDLLGAGPAPAPWPVDRVLPLPPGVTVVEQDGPIYLRVGQPPARTELYRLDPAPTSSRLAALAHLVPGERGTGQHSARPLTAAPLADWHLPSRWRFPCGGGSLLAISRGRHPQRLVVHSIDPDRPVYVQRA